MACITAQLADAVTAAINAGPLHSTTHTAIRRWYVRYNLADLKTLKISVVPWVSAEKRVSRQGIRHTRKLYVVFQQQVDPEKNSESDALMELAEGFLNFFFDGDGLEVTTAGGIPFLLDPTSPPGLIDPNRGPIDPQILNNERVFVAVLMVSFVSHVLTEGGE